jgi:Transposase IS66 family
LQACITLDCVFQAIDRSFRSGSCLIEGSNSKVVERPAVEVEKTAVRSPLLGARATQVFDLARLQKAPIAVEAVARIDALLAIEREISGLAPEQRVQRAQPALVLAQKIWLRQQLAKLSRRSESVTAIDYSLKRWTVLTRRRPPVHGQQCCRARRALRRGRA